MRITVDIKESVLEELLRLTGQTKKSPAVAIAAEEYVKRCKARQFGRLLREGHFDYPATNEEIESLEAHEDGAG